MNINEDIEKLNDTLDKFEQKVGLSQEINAKTIELCAELTSVDWMDHKNKSPFDLATDACILIDYANSLQRIINKEKAIVIWCKERIKRHCGRLIAMQNARSYEEREILALNQSEIGATLHRKRTESELHLTRLESLYFTYKNLADKLEKLADVKLKEEELNLRKRQLQ